MELGGAGVAQLGLSSAYTLEAGVLKHMSPVQGPWIPVCNVQDWLMQVILQVTRSPHV